MRWFSKKTNIKEQNDIEKVTCNNCQKTFNPFDIFVTDEGKSLCKKCTPKQK